MTCREFNDHITAAVDQRLSPELLAMFREHASGCPRCRREYEGERHIAELIRARIHPASAPRELVATILDSIAQEQGVGRETGPPLVVRLWRHPLAKPALGFLLAFATIVFFLLPPVSPTPEVITAGLSGNDIIAQSVANYQAVLKGEIVPEYTSDRPDRVRTFFEGKTEFPVYVPEMNECTLIGGVLKEYGGCALAQVVYRHGDQTIYICQACRETIMKGSTLKLTPEARDDLERTGWHVRTAGDGASIVLWTQGRTLCAAVSTLKGEHLMAHLTNAEVSGIW